MPVKKDLQEFKHAYKSCAPHLTSTDILQVHGMNLPKKLLEVVPFNDGAAAALVKDV